MPPALISAFGNVSAMLVLTTMFIAVSNDLPKTSYVKVETSQLNFELYSFYFVQLIIRNIYMER